MENPFIGDPSVMDEVGIEETQEVRDLEDREDAEQTPDDGH